MTGRPPPQPGQQPERQPGGQPGQDAEPAPVGRPDRAAWAFSALGLVAAGLHAIAPRLLALPQNPGGGGLGPEITTPTLTTMALVAGVGALVSLRFRAVGLAILSAATFSSAALAVWEFKPVVLVLPALLALSIAGLIWARATPISHQPSRRAALLALVAGVGAGLVLLQRGRNQHRDAYGPSHPPSTVDKPNWAAQWLWVGGVTPTTATIVAGGLEPGPYQLRWWAGSAEAGSPPGGSPVMAPADGDGIARFALDDLDPGTVHHYQVTPVDGDRTAGDRPADASFRTWSTGPHDLTIAFGSCARTGSNGAVFDAIRAQEPDLFVHLGDLHYGNLVSDRPADHHHVLGRSLSTPAQSAMFSSVPTAWVWDDHDFGDNNSNSTSPSRDAVSVAYRQAVPAWAVDPNPAQAINQAFTIGRVRVVMCDTRSMRTADTMLGREQEAWLKSELVASAQTHALVVWASPAPWNDDDQPGSDKWGGFAEERRRIANALADGEVSNLVMISGDWHLAAIDDGSNTGYATNDSGGFPLVHGGPLDRPSWPSPATYSHGSFIEPGQFGTIRVIDDGGPTVDVTLACHRWSGQTLVRLDRTFEVPGP